VCDDSDNGEPDEARHEEAVELTGFFVSQSRQGSLPIRHDRLPFD
jgi:hypothetical protein